MASGILESAQWPPSRKEADALARHYRTRTDQGQREDVRENANLLVDAIYDAGDTGERIADQYRIDSPAKIAQVVGAFEEGLRMRQNPVHKRPRK